MYIPRLADQVVADTLKFSGGVLIEGVRACGKTSTALQHAASAIALDSGDLYVESALDLQPQLLLEGETPHLIDEWQLAPKLWNMVRREIDQRQRVNPQNGKGQFILTGSAVPAEDATRHSGAMRISRIRMRPMILAENPQIDHPISLSGLFGGKLPTQTMYSAVTVPQALDLLVHGGWPSDFDAPTEQAQRHLQDYVDDVTHIDVNRLDGEPHRDPDRIFALMRSVARNVATEVNYSTIGADMAVSNSVKSETVSAYIAVLERLMVIERQNAWKPQLRSRARVRQSPKLHFVDPAIAANLLVTSADGLLRDRNTAGFLFESQVVQSLRTLIEPLGGNVYHYRDSNGREADVILQLRDSRWAAIEVKLSQNSVADGRESLNAFRNTIDTSKVGEPKFLAVVTADGPTLAFPDGVLTFPLVALNR